MNQDQFTGLFRTVLTIAGTLLTAAGVMSANEASAITADLMACVGPLFVLGSAVWTFLANRKASRIASVAAMPEVRNVVVEPSAAAIANADPTSAVVTPTQYAQKVGSSSGMTR